MTDNTTRRDFLARSGVAGSCFLLSQLPAEIGKTREPSPHSSPLPIAGTASTSSQSSSAWAPITVIKQSLARDVDPRAGLWCYIDEILQHAGLFFEARGPADLPTLDVDRHPIVLLAGNLQLSRSEQAALTALVDRGACVIGIGGTSGLDALFGVARTTPLAEGWIKITTPEHPVTAGLHSSLHVFGGCVATPSTATTLAALEAGVQRSAVGSAVLEHPFGAGYALLLAPDLLFSVAHIQQGVPVLQDGVPAPDGSAPLDDGILKAEDGLVLDWHRDRTPMQPDGTPVFLEPISDELRALILRGIFHAARRQAIALPMLWYWPRGLRAIGHISHDTDGNEPDKAEALLEVMNGCRVQSTWCVIYPGGYPRDFYQRLKDDGFEIALHYDAHTGGPRTSWSRENFQRQHQWLREEAGLSAIVSNKNHYTRWEHRLDFLHWCEQAGIRSDQTRGPSKRGTIGFPLGGSHPYFPFDDQADPPRRIDVLEINMLTQDLVVVCPAEYGRQLVDSVVRHHGIAHFLFHPAHILKPGVAESLTSLVDYGRSQGLQWWTSQQIDAWERGRREVRARGNFQRAATVSLTLQAETRLPDATLLVLQPTASTVSVRIQDQPVPSQLWSVYGFDFQAVTCDLVGEVLLEAS